MTECEIFLSLVVRLLEPDKPVWQRAVALEVIHKLAVRDDIITSFCTSYDMKPHSTKIVQVRPRAAALLPSPPPRAELGGSCTR